MFVMFLGTAVGNLFAQYLDVGDDPAKIMISSIKEIVIPDGYVFKAWSPDGEYFSASNEDEILASYYCMNRDDFIKMLPEKKDMVLKTFIFNKKGEKIQEFEGYSKWWAPDSKKVVLVDKEKKVLLCDIVDAEKLLFEINLGRKGIKSLLCFNSQGDTFYYFKESKIFAYKINTKISEDIYSVSDTPAILVGYFIPTNSMIFKGKSLLKINVAAKTATQLYFEKTNNVKFFPLKSNKDLLVAIQREKSYLFIDKDGMIEFKVINKFPNLPIERKNEFFNIQFSYLAPNGNLLAVSYGEVDDHTYKLTKSDIYLINRNGNYAQLTNTDNSIEEVQGWSPQGDRLTFYDRKTKLTCIATINKIPLDRMGYRGRSPDSRN